MNNLANPNATLNSILNNVITAAVVSLSCFAGFVATHRTRRLRSGAVAGLTAVALSAAIGLPALWLITLLFLDTIRHNTFMLRDFQRSGMQSLNAFIIDDTLGATFFGGLIVLGVGLASGTLGALLGKAARRFGQRAAS